MADSTIGRDGRRRFPPCNRWFLADPGLRCRVAAGGACLPGGALRM
jgi:hypothetical protein